MKTKLVAVTLCASTAAAAAFYPLAQTIGATPTGAAAAPVLERPPKDTLSHQRPQVDVVFVLDTTGSMGGLIEAAKEKIWSIASTMASAQPAPAIRMGLVAYRDRGDAYVTRVVDLSDDLDSVYAALMDFRAAGGGDGPESVNQALHDAIQRMSWSHSSQAHKTVFLVGDAPPHMDYQDDVKYPQTLAIAKARGIVVNAIQCGAERETARQWQHVAQLGAGRYFQVEQAGSAVAIATPLDEKIAELSAALDATRTYYGTAEARKRKQRKERATAKLHAGASAASRARRAAFNATAGGEANLLGEGELIDDVASGRVDLATIERRELPASMQSMQPEEQQALIDDTAKRRDALARQIKELGEQRAAFLKQKVAELGGAKDSLDHKIYSAIKAQAEDKGLRYEADAPTY